MGQRVVSGTGQKRNEQDGTGASGAGCRVCQSDYIDHDVAQIGNSMNGVDPHDGSVQFVGGSGMETHADCAGDP